MKLRLAADSIRLRLTQSEVARVGQGDEVRTHATLPDGSVIAVALSTCAPDGAQADHTQAVSAGLLARPGHVCLWVRLSPVRARDWAASDTVGIDARIDVRAATPGGAQATALRVLIEKDFKCLVPRPDEDGDDHYPHPAARTST